jgi:hypothetical protein
VDHHLQNAGQLLHEEYEGEDHASDERVREDFAENVTGQNAHEMALGLVYRAGALRADS